MSKYTTMLRWPVEQKLDDLGLNHTEDNWPQVYEMLGLSDYPIYEEAHRQVLNDKIIRHYYFREIGFETVGQFRWHMRSMMHEIMPYYNQLYQSEGFVTDPMLDRNMDFTEKWTRDEQIDTTQTDTGESNGTSSATTHSETNSDDRNVFQDTPMNGLDTGAIEAMDYATNVTFDHGESNTDGTSSGTTHNETSDNMTRGETGDYDGTREHNEKGYSKSQSDLLLTYRQTILNIDLEIVDRLDILFMGLW